VSGLLLVINLTQCPVSGALPCLEALKFNLLAPDAKKKIKKLLTFKKKEYKLKISKSKKEKIKNDE